MDWVRSTFLFVLVTVNLAEGAFCPDQFVHLGNFCYHFTDVEEDWVGARGVCEGIGIFQEETIILAVLDYGLSIHDNQLLLTNATNRGGSYWMGGNLDQSNKIWSWIDLDNRDIDLYANYWDANHPTTEGNCLMMVKDSYRSYVKAADCSQRSKVLCQIIPKDIGFRTIGRDAFYFSTENDIATVNTWQQARDLCSSLQPPNSFDHVDLAVLGMNHELDQDLLKVIAQNGNYVWLGGRHFANGDSGFTWIDERIVEETSFFLDPSHTTTEADQFNYFTYAAVTSVNGRARSTIKTCDPSGTATDYKYRCPSLLLNFVCQAYKAAL